jgi:hypothetical protein
MISTLTLYADVADRQPDGSLVLYDPSSGIPAEKLVYDFTKYPELRDCKKAVADAAAFWRGKLVSGQWWRWYTSFPDELKKTNIYTMRKSTNPNIGCGATQPSNIFGTHTNSGRD